MADSWELQENCVQSNQKIERGENCSCCVLANWTAMHILILVLLLQLTLHPCRAKCTFSKYLMRQVVFICKHYNPFIRRHTKYLYPWNLILLKIPHAICLFVQRAVMFTFFWLLFCLKSWWWWWSQKETAVMCNAPFSAEKIKISK